MGIADYMWDHAHGYCDIEGHYYDDRRCYPNNKDGDYEGERVQAQDKEQRRGAREMNDKDYNGTILRNYAVTSIVRPEDCADVYDVILTPCPRPQVSLRVRKQDLRKLVLAMETTAGDWYLNLDTGELSSGRGCVEQVVSAEVDGEEGLHFYGIRKENNDE